MAFSPGVIKKRARYEGKNSGPLCGISALFEYFRTALINISGRVDTLHLSNRFRSSDIVLVRRERQLLSGSVASRRGVSPWKGPAPRRVSKQQVMKERLKFNINEVTAL